MCIKELCIPIAYRTNRSMKDVVAIVLHATLSHLETQGSHQWLLFIDFSLTDWCDFPYRLVFKLFDMGLSYFTCMWIKKNFLMNRTPRVTVGPHIFTVLGLSTGSPQGCVLSPQLYTFYTHDCIPVLHSNTI